MAWQEATGRIKQSFSPTIWHALSNFQEDSPNKKLLMKLSVPNTQWVFRKRGWSFRLSFMTCHSGPRPQCQIHLEKQKIGARGKFLPCCLFAFLTTILQTAWPGLGSSWDGSLGVSACSDTMRTWIRIPSSQKNPGWPCMRPIHMEYNKEINS